VAVPEDLLCGGIAEIPEYVEMPYISCPAALCAPANRLFPASQYTEIYTNYSSLSGIFPDGLNFAGIC
jgi:hypothetical protein